MEQQRWAISFCFPIQHGVTARARYDDRRYRAWTEIGSFRDSHGRPDAKSPRNCRYKCAGDPAI